MSKRMAGLAYGGRSLASWFGWDTYRKPEPWVGPAGRVVTQGDVDELAAVIGLCDEAGYASTASLYREMLRRWADGLNVPVTPRTVVFVSSSSMAEGLTDRQRAQTAVVKRILLDGLNPFDNDTREAYGLARGNW